jgi:hypothetical protein
MKYVYKCIYMLLDDYGALQDQTEQVLGQNWKFCTSDPKNYAISEIHANSEILQACHAPGALLAQVSGPANMFFGCWLSVGSVVRSDAFLSTFYNFVTPKQHLGNAHNIKRFLK